MGSVSADPTSPEHEAGTAEDAASCRDPFTNKSFTDDEVFELEIGSEDARGFSPATKETKRLSSTS